MAFIIEEKCREINIRIKNMIARISDSIAVEREENLAKMKVILNKLVIKRIVILKNLFNKEILIELPPHKIRMVKCPLNKV